MFELKGSVVIVTGASRGIGAMLARALAAEGARLMLVARSESKLHEVAAAIGGSDVSVCAADLVDPRARARLVTETLRRLGRIDVLVNNAGEVLPAIYTQLTPEEIERTVALNLIAPMALARLVLPSMLEQNAGHIVNVASLAGICGLAFAEPYCATKHGLVGFTRSLRASLRAMGTPVSASVVNPGFVDDVGMYADNRATYGVHAPAALGTSPPGLVAAAVLRAIREDVAEQIVSPRPVRLLQMLSALSPRLGEWLLRLTGVHSGFRAVAAANGRGV
jgi:short-subunit dehydrogenase